MRFERNTFAPSFVDDIREMLAQARQKTYATVNFIMVETYWRIGRRIVEEEQQGKERADYGAFLIRELSRSLGSEFGKGFAVANLKNFRQFYLTFPDFEKSYAVRSQLSWSHYRLLMRVDKVEARDFYLCEAKDETVVRYSVLQGSEQLFASKYRLVLPSEEELASELNRERRLLMEQSENRTELKNEGGGYEG